MESTATIERPLTLVDAASLAGEIAGRIAPFAAEHDREGSFVAPAYAILRDTGFLALGVPSELGGGGGQSSRTRPRPLHAGPGLRVHGTRRLDACP